MSIFSSFDALCAELSYGQKLGFSLGSSKDSNFKAKVEGVSSSAAASSSVETMQKKNSSSSTPMPPSQPGQEKRTRVPTRPRFAPELDGVHCFESIVPY